MVNQRIVTVKDICLFNRQYTKPRQIVGCLCVLVTQRTVTTLHNINYMLKKCSVNKRVLSLIYPYHKIGL